MGLIKLSKKSFHGEPCIVGTDWVSNGHWAIPRTRLVPAQRTLGVEDWKKTLGLEIRNGITDERLAKSLQSKRREEWTVTGWVRIGFRVQHRVLERKGVYALLDEHYAGVLKLEPGQKIWTDNVDKGVFVTEHNEFIMALQSGDTMGNPPVAVPDAGDQRGGLTDTKEVTT